MTRNATYRGTCVRVRLADIAHNTRQLKRAMGDGVLVMAVVKANAYGHGMEAVARTALDNGASWLGVAIPEEGEALRRAGIQAPILVLGDVNAEGAAASAAAGLTQTVCDAQGVLRLERAAAACGIPAEAHIKLDTGMNRIGARSETEVADILGALFVAPRVRLTGAYTHFADADNPDEGFTRQQLARFDRLIAPLPQGLLLHAAASDASLRFPWARLGMVRQGIALYGYPPRGCEVDLRPALSFVTRVTFVKCVNPGDTISYGRAFRADQPLRVATLAVGYGDGYHRACSGRAHVLLRGAPCPVLGRVCMDQTMVDVTHAGDVAEGDEAVLLGAQGDRGITAGMLADWAGTIHYEVLLAPTARVPIMYV